MRPQEWPKCENRLSGKCVLIQWAAMLVFDSVQGLVRMNVHLKYEINKRNIFLVYRVNYVKILNERS